MITEEKAAEWVAKYLNAIGPKKVIRFPADLHQKMFKHGLHWCCRCKAFLEIKKFNSNTTTKFGLFSYCKFCHSESRPRKVNLRTKQRHQETKQRLLEIFGGKCARCGYREFSCSLHFHHIDPHTKTSSLGTLTFSSDFSKILAEADKCILLCGNCHHALESGHWNAIFVKAVSTTGWTIFQYSDTAAMLINGQIVPVKRKRNGGRHKISKQQEEI